MYIVAREGARFVPIAITHSCVKELGIELKYIVLNHIHVRILQGVLGHLKAAIAIMTGLEINTRAQHKLPVKRHFGPNKNLEKQLHFFQQRRG